MNLKVFKTLNNYRKEYLFNDIFTGIVIAMVSIPIAMGYAQIAGISAVYGLYGSVLPLFIFAMFTTSPHFNFGVDAAPCALVGASLLELGIEAGTDDAFAVVQLITLLTAAWLLIFYFIKAGRIVNFISTPVMGGFISGICCTIILMQFPKLFGGTAGTGELFELANHFAKSLSNINIPSLILGGSCLAIMLISKRLFPKFPMAIVIMLLGACLTVFVPVSDYGIKLLSSVEPGLPKFILPRFDVIGIIDALKVSLPIAIVIMMETLLAENNLATKNNYKIDENREILAFSMSNLASALTGAVPINGSVSRSSMSVQYKGKSQLSNIVASLVMALVLLFATGFIQYLPVPVLAGIVISALIGATEYKMAIKLFRENRKEFYIFLGAFVGVLIFGTIYGVLIGIVLSFIEVIIRASKPSRCFLGVLPGHEDFFNMTMFRYTYPIKGVVIYRFSSDLFFANAGIFQNDIENAIKDDTKAVIIDASGITSIDSTAAERLQIIRRNLNEKGIKFYITEHISDLNVQLRRFGLGDLITDGCVRQSIETALSDLGLSHPYPLVGADNTEHSIIRKRAENTVQEFVWAFGNGAENEIERQIHIQIAKLKENGSLEAITTGNWKKLGEIDEDEWLSHLEAHLSELVSLSGEDELTIARRLESRRIELFKKIAKEHPELAEKFRERHDYMDEQLKKKHPDIYAKIIALKEGL